VEDFHRAALTLSHDLRRHLRSIMTLAEELASGQHGALNATGTSHAGQIARSAGRLEALAEEILGKAREAYAQGPAPEIAIDLDEVFRDAVAFLHQLITERHATVVIRSPMHRVVGRYVPMLQIAANLLTNALKHGPDDLPPRVDIWSEEISGRVRLSLKDNRGGLHPHAHAMLFEPFTSFAQQRTVESGLGLAITRGAIAQLGGGISVTTAQGVGSLFTVTLRPALPGSGSPFNGRQGN
jgi:signal transduction histidine kinase